MENKNFFNHHAPEKVSLFEWVSMHSSEDEMRDVFLNMDIALKYIHEHGYCIEVFFPSYIEILNDDPNYVQFVRLMELSKDPIRRKKMIQEDIFKSSLIQIGFYSNTLRSLTPEFLKENFDDVAKFVPEGDIPYYRGVVQRGASVYFSEYSLEKANRDLIQLESQLQESEGGLSTPKRVESNMEVKPLDNDEINNAIYKQINGFKDAAFISLLVIPTVALICLVIIAFIGWILSLS